VCFCSTPSLLTSQRAHFGLVIGFPANFLMIPINRALSLAVSRRWYSPSLPLPPTTANHLDFLQNQGAPLSFLIPFVFAIASLTYFVLPYRFLIGFCFFPGGDSSARGAEDPSPALSFSGFYSFRPFPSPFPPD